MTWHSFTSILYWQLKFMTSSSLCDWKHDLILVHAATSVCTWWQKKMLEVTNNFWFDELALTVQYCL